MVYRHYILDSCYMLDKMTSLVETQSETGANASGCHDEKQLSDDVPNETRASVSIIFRLTFSLRSSHAGPRPKDVPEVTFYKFLPVGHYLFRNMFMLVGSRHKKHRRQSDS